MSNQKYNSDEFIQFLINYFKEIPPEKKKKSFRKLYQEEILHSGEKKASDCRVFHKPETFFSQN